MTRPEEEAARLLSAAESLLAQMEARDAAQQGRKDSRKPHTKVCPKCGQEKTLGDFYPGRTKQGVSSWCRRCMNAASNAWHARQKAAASHPASSPSPSGGGAGQDE